MKDLLFKVKDQAVCDYLVEVSKTSLHGCRAPWGGSTADDLLWRYGVTVIDESLDERHLNDRQKLARTYRIIYVFRPKRQSYEILGIVTEGELIAAYNFD